MPTYQGRTLDRRPAADPRDNAYPVKPALEQVPKLRKAYRRVRGRTWRLTEWNEAAHTYQPVRLDQGPDGACVGFGWSHEAAANPWKYPVTNASAFDVYQKAQQVDEFEDTPPAEGTSVRAGAKVLQQAGIIAEYRWPSTVGEIAEAVATLTPVVIGIGVTESMFDTDEHGWWHVEGDVVGGHCVCIRGVAMVRRYFRIVNSWGPGWAENGECFLHFDDLEKLMAADGEAVIPTEVPLTT